MSTSQYKPIPLFKGAPLIGCWSDFQNDRLGLLLRVARECGDFGEFRVGPQSIFLANSPAILQELLVEKAARLTPEPFAKSFYPITGRTALPGIDGEYHRRIRRMMAPAFQHKRLVGYSQTMVALTDECQRGVRDGAEVDMSRLMHHLTRNIIAECVFRVDFREEERFFECVRIAAEFIGDGAANPLKFPIWVPTPSNLRTQQAVEYFRQRTVELLDMSRKRGDVGDVLSMLLLAKDEDGTGLTEEELRDQALILYLAGHETSSNALSWFWLTLAQHPEVQARVQSEVDAVLGGRPPAYEDLRQMPYLTQVIKETLRLYPAGHLFGRAPIEDMEIGGHWMRKGQFIMVCPYVVHRHPEIFPDPERFDPDRFTPEREKKLPRSAYFPFSNGPHICIGMHFAMMEMQLVVAHMSQHLSFSLASNEPVRALPLATLTPSPFTLKASRRKVAMALAS